MSFEVEMKFPVKDVPRLEKAILDQGGRLEKTVQHIDQYFQHPNRDFGQTDEALRIRQQEDDLFITYKGPKTGTVGKIREELELPFGLHGSDFNTMCEILEKLGFNPSICVSKSRKVYIIQEDQDRYEITIDQVDNLGNYSEIELQTNVSDLGAAGEKVQAMAERIGLKHDTRKSYLELLLESQD